MHMYIVKYVVVRCLWKVFNLELLVYFWFEIVWFADYIQLNFDAGVTFVKIQASKGRSICKYLIYSMPSN